MGTAKGRGEGSRLTMEPRGGKSDAWFPPKIHGLGYEVSPGTSCPGLAVKRSLKRARCRARQDGWAFYRGRLLSMADLGGAS